MNGMTLVELLVAIAILSIGLAMSAVSFAPLFDRDEDRSVERAAESAIRGGVAVGTAGDSVVSPVFFLPDGRAVGARDPLVGGLRAGQ